MWTFGGRGGVVRLFITHNGGCGRPDLGGGVVLGVVVRWIAFLFHVLLWVALVFASSVIGCLGFAALVLARRGLLTGQQQQSPIFDKVCLCISVSASVGFCNRTSP